MKRKIAPLSVLLLVGVTASGCSTGGGGTVDADPAKIRQQQEKQIEKIQNDPNMPEPAKQAAINSIRSNMQRGPTTK